jgi:hypothetical protein
VALAVSVDVEWYEQGKMGWLRMADEPKRGSAWTREHARVFDDTAEETS